MWGSGEPQGGYYDAELLDGRRGLVPASYVTRLIGNKLIINLLVFNRFTQVNFICSWIN